MKKRFKDWDIKISKKYPKIWILGIHIYLPLLVFSALLFYALGWAFYTSDVPRMKEVNEYGFGILQFAIIPMVLVAILYAIRQIKYNSLRVHHHMPYKNPYLSFITYFVVFFILTAVPLMAGIGLHHKFSLQIDERQYIEDLSILNKGYSHFYQSDFSNTEYLQDDMAEIIEGTDAVDLEYRTVKSILNTYRIDEKSKNLILYRHSAYSAVNGSYIGDTSLHCFAKLGWDTISVEQAYKEMSDFMAIAPKYYAKIKQTNVQQILEQHLTHVSLYRDVQDYKSPDFNLIEHRTRFEDVLETYASVVTIDDVFFGAAFYFWVFYIITPLVLSSLLLIVCSVKIADFGWAMLVIALAGMFMMIANGLLDVSNRANGDAELQFNLLLITLLIVVFLIMIVSKNLKSQISKAFTVAFQLMIPFAIFAYFAILDQLHECPYRGEYYLEQCEDFEFFESQAYYMTAYGICVLICLTGIYIFNQVYTKKYVHPRLY
jgi:hypothetical protein